MNRASILFLKLVIILVGSIVLTGLIVFPQTEGRAVGLDVVSIYGDPLIIFSCLASIPFFVALYQGIKLLGYAGQGTFFSSQALNALEMVQYCALSLVGLLLAALVLIRFLVTGDDPAGPTMVGMLAILASIVIAAAAAVMQRLLKNAVNLQFEQELTV